MIYIVANSKGGVGKSLTSVTLACLLEIRQKNFKIVEIDNNNQSLLFANSDFLNEKNSLSVRLDKRQEIASDILFNLMSDDELDYVIDAGGGDDTFQVLQILKDLELPKTYLIPTTRIKKYLKNAADTFQFIDDPGNTYFVLNQYSNLEKLKDEFLYFFGNKKLGIKPVSDSFATDNVLYIPYSNYFQISEDMEMTILDLANISRQIDQKQAAEQFFKQSNGSREVFHSLMTKYWNSEEASKDLLEIEQNFEKLWEVSKSV